MKAEIENFLETRRNLANRLRAYVVDEDIPLNERWEVFILSELGDDDPYIVRFENPLLEEYVDGLTDKYETIPVKGIIESIENDDSSKEGLLNDAKEEILSLFLKSFTFDW